jgi:hypothetical protein
MRKITLIVDDEWYKAIVNLTNDVYAGETCRWLEVIDMGTECDVCEAKDGEPHCKCGNCDCAEPEVKEMDGVS